MDSNSDIKYTPEYVNEMIENRRKQANAVTDYRPEWDKFIPVDMSEPGWLQRHWLEHYGEELHKSVENAE